MNYCPNCNDPFETNGIGIYFQRNLRTFCGWVCVRQAAELAQDVVDYWPPPIPDKKFIEQNKK
jgi:hypothetical protein